MKDLFKHALNKTSLLFMSWFFPSLLTSWTLAFMTLNEVNVLLHDILFIDILFLWLKHWLSKYPSIYLLMFIHIYFVM